MDIAHKVYINNKLVKTFLHSSWYDTTTPYHACQKELKDLMWHIKPGYSITIESHGNIHVIKTLKEYKEWLKNVFGGGFEDIVPDYIQS